MTNVTEDGRISPGCTGIYTDAQAAAWKRIVDFVHRRTEAKICLQLGHAGRKASTCLPWQEPGMDHPLPDGNWPIMAASPIPYYPESQVPKEMDRADMDALKDAYIAAAKRCDWAGFDMVEVHMAHGYLLASFISPVTNKRTDDYGGSLENRMRFPLEIFDAVRAVWPDEKPMAARISACDWIDGGITGEDAVDVARMLKDHGCDIVDVSSGQTDPAEEPVYGRMFQAPFSDRIRHEVGIPTITVGNIFSADQVNTLLAAGRADIVALARPHLTDPYFTQHAAAHYGYDGLSWPEPYHAGRNQALMMAERDNEELAELRAAAAPVKPQEMLKAAE
jgi:anthraniloyl-CoA monooxygenase